MLGKIFGRREAEVQGKATNRLPSGQSLTQKFPVLHYGSVPDTHLSQWDFRIYGLVEVEKTWNWAEFNQLPRTKIQLDLHCVTRWSKLDTTWEGVSLKSLVDGGFINIKPEANYVIQHCEQGYTTNTPLELLMQDNMLMATHYDGQPLTPDHGYPLRMVIGSFADRSEKKSAYLWKGGKWLRALEFRQDDQLGFWERLGYHNEADPWKEQRFSGFSFLG